MGDQPPKTGAEFKAVTDRGGRQTLSVDQLYDTADDVNKSLGQFLDELERRYDLTIIKADIKDRGVAENKIARKFRGAEDLLNDVVRGTIIVNNQEEFEIVQTIIEGLQSELMRKHGLSVMDKSDHIQEPIDYTWYRGLQYKIGVPTKYDEPHIAELQVTTTAMNEIYHITHPHKRAAEEIYNKAAREKRGLTEEEVHQVDCHYAVCQYYNSRVSERDGFNKNLKNPEAFAFTPERQVRLIKLMAEIGVPPDLDEKTEGYDPYDHVLGQEPDDDLTQ